MTMRCGTLLRLTRKRGEDCHKSDRELPGRQADKHDNTSAAFELVGTCSAASAGEVFGVPHRRPGDTRSAHPVCRENSALSSKELHAPLCDEETWLTEGFSGAFAKRATLRNNKDEVWGEDGETASLTSECLQEDLSSSDDKDFSWEALEPTKCPQTFASSARLRLRTGGVGLPRGLAAQSSAGGKQRPAGGVHAGFKLKWFRNGLRELKEELGSKTAFVA
eukprot:2696984-Amphidinium_carterae.1